MQIPIQIFRQLNSNNCHDLCSQCENNICVECQEKNKMAPLCQCTAGFYYNKEINDCIQCDKDCNYCDEQQCQNVKYDTNKFFTDIAVTLFIIGGFVILLIICRIYFTCKAKKLKQKIRNLQTQKAKQQEIKDQENLEQSKNKTVKNQGILKQKTQFEPLAIQINQNNNKVNQISNSCKKEQDKLLNQEQQTLNLNKNSQKSKLNQKSQLQPIVLNRKFKNSSQYSSYSISTQEDINQFNQNIKNKSTSVKFNLNENEYFNVPLQSK